jgi:peptidoglycan L-alanyl-D-glutamate endopeptidase CwlK
MINHSDLMAQLKAAKPGDQTEHNALVSRLTAGGVIMEAGPLAEKVQPNWRVDSLMRSDLPMQATDNSAIVTVQRDSGFKFGASSERELVGVNADLVRVTRLALRYSLQDFTVYDGIRSVKEQQQHVKNGTSKTMQSKHLQGLAVDLVPWINGAPKWDWDGCYKIACAVDLAATELGLAHRITWGGAWDRKLSDFGGDPAAYAREVQAYQKRHPGPDFIDGPHFEILP